VTVGRTISDKQGMIVAGQEANKNRKPLIFDPVAVGATSYRRETAKGQFVAHVHDYLLPIACANLPGVNPMQNCSLLGNPQ
jgi:hypothetical protein